MDIGTLVGYLELEDSKFRKTLGDMPMWMATAGAAAGVAVAAAFVASVVAGMNVEAANDKVAAQLGLTEEESRRAGEAAANAYGSGFGGSLETVQSTTAGVVSSIRGMRDASVEELQGIVTGVQGVSDAFGVEADRISQVVGQMLSTGMADSAQEGLDLLTAALQKVPAAVREDVLDATDEYGPFFAQIGLSGEEAMGALVAASEKGMYGIDKTGDAIKELSIRATDMSDASKAAYESMGLNAEEMAAKILAGGEQGAQGFQQIVDGLLGIQDPVAQSQAALALFGTPLEDLGTSEIPAFLQGLQGLEDGMLGAEGATQRMTDTMGGNALSTWGQIQRSVELLATSIGEKFLPIVGPALEAVLAGFSAVTPVLVEFASGIADFIASSDLFVPILAGLAAGLLYLLAPAMWAAVTATWAWTAALLANPVTWIVVGIMAVIAALVWLITNWDTAVAWITEVWGGFLGWLTGVVDGFVAWWNGVWAGVGTWITEVWSGFTAWVQGAALGFASFIVSLFVGFLAWWNGLWAGVGAFVQGVWAGFIGWVQGVANGFVSFLVGAFNGYLSFWSGLWNGVRSTIVGIWEGIVGWFQGIPGAIKAVFSGAASWLYQIGRDIINGLWNGLKAVAGSITSWFENTFGGIIDTVRGIFQIASPSRVFRQIGVHVGEGFVDGLDRMQPEVDQAMEDMTRVPDTAGEFLARYPVGAGATPVGGPSLTYVAAENQSLSSEEALYAALGSPRSPFGGV